MSSTNNPVFLLGEKVNAEALEDLKEALDACMGATGEEQMEWEDLRQPANERSLFCMTLSYREKTNTSVQRTIKAMTACGLPKTCEEITSGGELTDGFVKFLSESKCTDEYKTVLASTYAQLASTGKFSLDQVQMELAGIRSSMLTAEGYKRAMLDCLEKSSSTSKKVRDDLRDRKMSDKDVTVLFALLVKSHSLGGLLRQSDVAELTEKEKKATNTYLSVFAALELS